MKHEIVGPGKPGVLGRETQPQSRSGSLTEDKYQGLYGALNDNVEAMRRQNLHSWFNKEVRVKADKEHTRGGQTGVVIGMHTFERGKLAVLFKQTCPDTGKPVAQFISPEYLERMPRDNCSPK